MPSASGRNPGTRTGRVTAAVTTIEVPITDANQLGPTAASASRRSSRAARKPCPAEECPVGLPTKAGGGGEVAVTSRACAAPAACATRAAPRLWLAASATVAEHDLDTLADG
jgi:hypothetical protein